MADEQQVIVMTAQVHCDEHSLENRDGSFEAIKHRHQNWAHGPTKALPDNVSNITGGCVDDHGIVPEDGEEFLVAYIRNETLPRIARRLPSRSDEDYARDNLAAAVLLLEAFAEGQRTIRYGSKHEPEIEEATDGS